MADQKSVLYGQLSPEALAETHEKYCALGAEIVKSAPQLFIDADVEGDGPAGFGSLLSIGAIAPNGETFYVELKPQTSKYWQKQHKFCEMHGLARERLIREGISIEEAGQRFAEWTIKLREQYGKQPVFTAFNAGYDWAHTDLAIARAGIVDNPFGVAPFDIKSLAMAIVSSWDWDETSKTKLPPVLTPQQQFTHNALEDSRWQQEQHFTLVGMLNWGRYPDIERKIRSQQLSQTAIQ